MVGRRERTAALPTHQTKEEGNINPVVFYPLVVLLAALLVYMLFGNGRNPFRCRRG